MTVSFSQDLLENLAEASYSAFTVFYFKTFNTRARPWVHLVQEDKNIYTELVQMCVQHKTETPEELHRVWYCHYDKLGWKPGNKKRDAFLEHPWMQRSFLAIPENAQLIMILLVNVVNGVMSWSVGLADTEGEEEVGLMC